MSVIGQYFTDSFCHKMAQLNILKGGMIKWKICDVMLKQLVMIAIYGSAHRMRFKK